MKVCAACTVSRPRADFTACNTAGDGLAPWCIACAHTWIESYWEDQSKTGRKNSSGNRRKTPVDCSLDGCTNAGNRRGGLCGRHYREALTKGTMPPRKPRTTKT